VSTPDILCLKKRILFYFEWGEEVRRGGWA